MKILFENNEIETIKISCPDFVDSTPLKKKKDGLVNFTNSNLGRYWSSSSDEINKFINGNQINSGQTSELSYSRKREPTEQEVKAFKQCTSEATSLYSQIQRLQISLQVKRIAKLFVLLQMSEKVTRINNYSCDSYYHLLRNSIRHDSQIWSDRFILDMFNWLQGDTGNGTGSVNRPLIPRYNNAPGKLALIKVIQDQKQVIIHLNNMYKDSPVANHVCVDLALKGFCSIVGDAMSTLKKYHRVNPNRFAETIINYGRYVSHVQSEQEVERRDGHEKNKRFALLDRNTPKSIDDYLRITGRL